MPDREKVIKALKMCTSGICTPDECPYSEGACDADLMEEAFELLKEQEETELCDRCGRVRLKSKWEGR